MQTRFEQFKCPSDGELFVIFKQIMNAEPYPYLLDLSNGYITNTGVSQLIKFMKATPKLIGLNLLGNDIFKAGVEEFAEFFSSHPCSLRALNLSSNELGDIGVAQLFSALEVKDRLIYLSLNDVDITDVAVKHMPKLSIRRLDLSWNSLRSLEVVTDILKKLPLLEVLNLSHNCIDISFIPHKNKAIDNFRNALNQHKKLKALDFIGNNLDSGLTSDPRVKFLSPLELKEKEKIKHEYSSSAATIMSVLHTCQQPIEIEIKPIYTSFKEEEKKADKTFVPWAMTNKQEKIIDDLMRSCLEEDLCASMLSLVDTHRMSP